MARELGLGLSSLLRATRRATRATKEHLKLTRAVAKEQAKVDAGDKDAKAKLRLLKREERKAFREARRARRAIRSEESAIYRDSRIDLRGIYSTIGNHREKIPTLFRSLSEGRVSTLVSVFGEGIAGVTKAAPFMAAAGGFLALLYPILEERDKIQKELILAQVKTLIEEAAEKLKRAFRSPSGAAQDDLKKLTKLMGDTESDQ